MDRLSKIKESGIKLSLTEATKVIEAEVKGHIKYGDDPDASRIIFVIGNHGEAKTRCLQQIAARLDLAYASFHAGAIDSQDNTGLQQIVDAMTVHNKPAHLPIFSAPKSKSGYGLFVFEEFCSNDNNEFQNQARQLSEGRLGELVKHPKWILAATSNPEGDEYSTVNKMDEALVSRLIIVPVKTTAAEKLDYWRNKAGEKMFERLYWFLVTNQALIDAVDARSWYNLGRTLSNLETINAPRELIEASVTIAAGREVAAAYNVFLECGNDPEKYPIGGDALMNAPIDLLSTYCDRIRHWHKGNPQLIFATKYDLCAYLNKAPANKVPGYVNNIVAVSTAIGCEGCADMVLDVLNTVKDLNHVVATEVTNRLTGTEAGDRLIETFRKSYGHKEGSHGNPEGVKQRRPRGVKASQP